MPIYPSSCLPLAPAPPQPLSPPLGCPCSARRVFALKLKKFSLCAVRRRPPYPAPRQSSPADCALIYMLNNFCALVRREIVSNASHIKAKYDSALSCAVLALSCVLFATSKYMHCFYCYCFSHVSPFILRLLLLSFAFWLRLRFGIRLRNGLCRAHLANQELIKSRSQKLRLKS